ncbi:MAG: universal stress protein [Deltaproteobacteria bacterium]|nr:universal stress protein [Deltaproteobacteria bacterium]MBW1718090.1 universal stress protein [Deltaproteobacteria bacterium]MBW1932205.1 universal stress protein [Deltaproteobacteria bacterium]MBW1937524.1 universal stress protein [Deltaproteobacteria bacterium]MBW1964611.1 universal stress protein [Deltaproteobacteria bacterium]
MNTKIQDIMRKAVLIGQDAVFVDALRKMIIDKTNSLLVVNKSGKLIGEMQSFDLIRQVVPGYVVSDEIAAHFATEEIFKDACEAAKNIPIEKFMNKDPKTITLESSLMEAVVIAMSHGQSRIPVVDEQHQPLGVLSRTELKQAITKFINIEEGSTKETMAEPMVRKAGAVEPLTSFLLPVDGSEPSKRAVSFSGCLTSALADRVQTITLLRVLAGGYLKRHLADMAKVRVKGEIIESDIFKTSREDHISKNITPMLAEAEAELKKFGAKAPINQKIADGVPAEQILQVAEEGDYSTIIMSRRGVSAVREALLGSVTASLLHKPVHQSVYVIGAKVEILKAGACPIPRILVPLDGSPHAVAAVREAAILAKCYGNAVAEVTLLNVIDLARYAKREHTNQTQEDILNEAQQIFTDSGISESKIVSVVEYGTPGEVILNTAKKKQVNLLIIGRRGRSAFQELFMGSVSREVVQRCTDSTVGVVSG